MSISSGGLETRFLGEPTDEMEGFPEQKLGSVPAGSGGVGKASAQRPAPIRMSVSGYRLRNSCFTVSTISLGRKGFAM